MQVIPDKTRAGRLASRSYSYLLRRYPIYLEPLIFPSPKTRDQESPQHHQARRAEKARVHALHVKFRAVRGGKNGKIEIYTQGIRKSIFGLMRTSLPYAPCISHIGTPRP